VKKQEFLQKLPGNAAVLFRHYTRRGFAPPFRPGISNLHKPFWNRPVVVSATD
jgi:hypothetical protein